MNKAEMLARFSKPVVKKVTIDGSDFHIRVMSGTARDGFESFLVAKRTGTGRDTGVKDVKNVRAALVSRSLCDESGELLFTDKPEDLDALNGIDSVVLDQLADECSKLNRLDMLKGKESAEGN